MPLPKALRNEHEAARVHYAGLGGAAAAWPLAASAQQNTNIARIGFLGPASASSSTGRLEAFRSGLRDLGYTEGQNIVIVSRWADENTIASLGWQTNWSISRSTLS